MKKYTLLIIAGGVFLITGLILSFGKKNDKIIYYYEENISQEEATSIIIEKVKNIIDIYEHKNDTFKVINNTSIEDDVEADEQIEKTQEKEELYIQVSNYDEVIDDLYTKDGKLELESTVFNDNLFVKKNDKDVFLLNDIPKKNKYSNSSISISDVVVNKNEVRAKVAFTNDELDKDDVLTYYIYEIKIELIKENDKWLVNSFNYSTV